MDTKKDIVVGIVVDPKGAEQGAKQVEQSLKGIEKEQKKINDTPLTLGERLAKIKGEIDAGGLSMRELTRKLQDYQTIAIDAGRTSPIGKAALNEAANLQDKLTDLRNEVTRLANDGKNMQGALQLGQSVMAGYGAMQGVMALAGQENEALMQSLVKMQAAQSVLTGIEQIRLSLEKESAMMLVFRNTQTKIATALTTAYATVVGTATGALRIFKLALVATGIGAIIVGLGLLIANFDLVSEIVTKTSKRIYDFVRSIKDMSAGMQVAIGILTFGLVPAFNFLIDTLEDMGVVDDDETKKMKANAKAKRDAIKKETDAIISDLNRQSEANRKATDNAVNNLDYEIRKRQAAGEDTKKLEREKIMLLINSTKTELALIQQKIDAKQNEINKSIGFNQVLAKVTKEKDEAIFESQKETLDKLIQDLEIFDIGERKRSMDEIARKKETSKKKKDIVKKEISEEEKLRKEQQDADKKAFDLKQKAIADEEAVTEAYRKRQLSAQQKELDDLNEKLNNELLAVGNNEELKLLLEEEYLAKKNEIVNKYIDLEDEAKKKQAQEELQRKLDNADKVNNATQNTFDFANNLNAAFGKNSEKAAKREFQINKAKNIADATSDGYKAVLSTFANTPTGIVGKSIAATAAGVFAASNIAKIVSSRYEGGGGGASASASVSIPRVSSGGANGGATGQAQQNDNLTNIASLLNNQPSPVLVVDSFNKVNNEASKIKTVSSI